MIREWMIFKNYSKTYQHHVLTTIKKYTKAAFKEKLIEMNPFDGFVIGGQSDSLEKEWNTESEIQQLKELLNKDLGQRLMSTLVHYLHSCYTGLRAVDERTFDPKENVEGNFIKITPSKTQNSSEIRLVIPLNQSAKELHPYLTKYKLKVKHARLGDDLKELMQMINCDKHITFHCARHTFAINSLIRGAPLEVVSKWLGHTQLKTTQIYARIVESLSTTHMKKWDTKHSDLSFDTVTENGFSAKITYKEKSFLSKKFLTEKELYDFLLSNLR